MKYILASLLGLIILDLFAVVLFCFQEITGILPVFDFILLLVSICFLFYSVFTQKLLRLSSLAFILMLSIWVVRNGAISYNSTELQGERISLFSLNVGQFNNDTSQVNFIANKILELQPDIVALQEFGLYYKWPNIESMTNDFSSKIGYSHYYFKPHSGNIFGTAVFSKYPIIRSELIFNELSRTNESWKHLVVINNDSIWIVNTHLESFNFSGDNPLPIPEVMKRQMEQARLILRSDFSNHKTVICGDFNAVSGSPCYQLFSKEFEDVLLESGMGWLPTHKTIPVRIDHFFRNMNTTVSNIKLVWDTPSDHAGLLVHIH